MAGTAMTSDDIRDLLVRFFVDSDRSPETTQYDEPEYEVGVTVVPGMFTQPIHDEDYIVFQHFKDERDTVLDIGANFGYSAVAMWQVGLRAGIASFEPIKGFEPILKEVGRKRARSQGLLRRLFGSRPYEFYITGLSDEEGEIEFYSSVINGRMLSGLTTALKTPSIDAYVSLVCAHAERYVGDIRSFKIYAFRSPVTTLDRWIASGTSKLNLDRTVALKIDTEGFEGRVLRGGQDLLEARRPLVMAEGGHQNNLVLETLLGLGYSLAEREGDLLRVSSAPTQCVNGFFVHPDNFDFYRRIGLMTGRSEYTPAMQSQTSLSNGPKGRTNPEDGLAVRSCRFA